MQAFTRNGVAVLASFLLCAGCVTPSRKDAGDSIASAPSVIHRGMTREKVEQLLQPLKSSRQAMTSGLQYTIYTLPGSYPDIAVCYVWARYPGPCPDDTVAFVAKNE